MNSGVTAERVYREVRSRILENAFRPGARLDPAAMSPELSASATPIREALHVLAGEGLVETRTGSGFFMPHVDHPSLVDRYRWCHDVLSVALTARSRATEIGETGAGHRGTVLDRTEALFLAICARSGNREHVREMEALNARLRAARSLEPSLLTDVNDELAGLATAFAAPDMAALRVRLRHYHQRRYRIVADLLRLLYR